MLLVFESHRDGVYAGQTWRYKDGKVWRITRVYRNYVDLICLKSGFCSTGYLAAFLVDHEEWTPCS